MKLSELNVHGKGKIIEIKGNIKYITKLKNLGISIGETVELKRKSFFNGPIEIEVNGILVALRKENASLIEVEIL